MTRVPPRDQTERFMFVPVACAECGKPFQVTEAAAGQSVACPWCRASVLALPVAAAAPQGEVLSLDDPAPPPAARLRPRFVTPLVVPTGPRPRLYMLAVEGKGVKPDDPAVRRFFNSFRVAN